MDIVLGVRFFAIKMIELALESRQVGWPTEQTLIYKVYRILWSTWSVFWQTVISVYIS